MDNNPQGTATTASAKEGQSIHAGLKLSEFKEGIGRPSGYSAGDVDMLRKVAQAFLNIEIRRKLAVPDSSGVTTASGDVNISDDKVIIELYDAPSGGSAFFNTTQSVSLSCPSGTTGISITVTVAAGTIGSNVDQATANTLALELATDRANNSLVCTPNYNGTIYQILSFSDGTYMVLGQFTACAQFSRFFMAFVDQHLRLYSPSVLQLLSNGTINLPFACVRQGAGSSGEDLVYLVGRYLEQAAGQETTYQIYSFDQWGFQNGSFAPPNSSSPWVFGTSLATYPESICLVGAGSSNLAVCGIGFTTYGGTASAPPIVIDATAAFVNHATTYTALPGTLHWFCATTTTGYIVWGDQGFAQGYNAYDPSSTNLFNPIGILLRGFASQFGVVCQSSGNIIAAGGNTDYYGHAQTAVNDSGHGATGTGIQRIKISNGATDSTFASYAGAGFNGGGGGYQIFAIAIDNTDRIYVATNALYYNGTFIYPATLVRLDSSGNLDGTWPVIYGTGNITSSGFGPTGPSINHVIIDVGGNVVAGGNFSAINIGGVSTAANSLVKLNQSGVRI